MIAAFERASGRTIPYRMVARHRGDIAECYADPLRAERILGWTARRTLDEIYTDTIYTDTWRWLRHNDDGRAGA